MEGCGSTVFICALSLDDLDVEMRGQGAVRVRPYEYLLPTQRFDMSRGLNVVINVRRCGKGFIHEQCMPLLCTSTTYEVLAYEGHGDKTKSVRQSAGVVLLSHSVLFGPAEDG
jgi:hypothetical protein